MKVLVINCGSSSLKFRLFQMPEEKVLATGSANKNGEGNTSVILTIGKKEIRQNTGGFNYEESLNLVLNQLLQPENRCLESFDDIDVVGHRLIHGGELKENVAEIDQSLLEYMESCIHLAPLHYPPNLAGIKATQKLAPHALQAGVFDTAFHQTLPPEAYLYGLPYKWYEKHKIRRFGFHGTSHRYASSRACQLTGRIPERSKIVSCHLGNGASVAAVRNGISVDTSMGMTPAEGLLMGTRSGDIDPGILFYLQENYQLSAGEINQLINKEGGLLGLSGVSSDFLKVEEAAQKGNRQAQMALGVYFYRIKKYIGAYMAVLGGANILVFTGGIGENSATAREIVTRGMEWCGISVRPELNREASGREAVISALNSPVQVVVVPANEELVIARDVAQMAIRKKKG